MLKFVLAFLLALAGRARKGERRLRLENSHLFWHYWKTAAPADVAGINVNSRNEVGILLCIGRWKTVVWLLLQSYYKWGPILMPEVMLLLIHLCFGRLDGMQISL